MANRIYFRYNLSKRREDSISIPRIACHYCVAISVIPLIVIALCSNASADSIRAIGLMDVSGWTTQKSGASIGAAGIPTLGFGLGYERSLGTSVSIDSSIQKVDRKYKYSVLGTEYTNEASAVELPIGFRFRFMDSFSLALGGYAAWLGPLKGSTPNNVGLKTFDYGLQGSVAYEWPEESTLGLWGEGRYLRGLANISTDLAATAHFEEAQIITGIRVDLR